MSEKTEQPTPQRLRKAREDGQVAKSRLLSSAASTAAAIAAAVATAPRSGAQLQRWAAALLSSPDRSPRAALAEATWMFASAAWAPLAAAFVTSAAVSLATTGFLFRPSLVAPKLERVDPLSGIRKLVSSRQVMDLLRNVAIAAAVGWILYCGARDAAPVALRAVRSGPGFPAVLDVLEPAIVRAAVALLAFGAADLWLARRRLRHDLMMTREEVRREHREAEGDPQLKAKRKSLRRQLASGGPARGVQRATAVVVNPTHLAVALRYAPDECGAPYLVAKGREADALALRREAARLGIPVVKDIPLARSLIHYDVGEEIPEELYRAAAAVLSAAMQRAGEGPQEERA